MKLSALGEFGFIERIRRAAGAGHGLTLGIGDDCAAAAIPSGELLLTSTDLLIESVHFRRDWTDLHRLGRKSVAVNVSDIAAMGGTPRHLYLGLGLPEGISVEDLDAFIGGFLAAAADSETVLAGGDTCRSPGPLLIAVTVQGSVSPEEMVRRTGARPGEDLYVSGSLGDSALALKRLLAGEVPDPFLAERHHNPTARYRLGRALAQEGLATAMIDLSDGLLADLGHLLESSNVGALIELGALPLSERFRAAMEQEADLIDLALGGGEDYELLFTASPKRAGEVEALSRRLGLPLQRVGVVTGEARNLTLLDGSGKSYPCRRTGFNHFASGE